MTNFTTKLLVAGFELVGAKDKQKRFVLVPEIEKAFGWRANQAREKVVSKSLEAFAGAVIRLGKKKDNRGTSRGYVSLVSTKDFMTLVGWEATNGNKQALALLIALATETIDRRIDAALGQTESEDDYETNTRAFYRELARKSFQPELCSWFASQHAIDYGAEVNLFKRSLKLPLVNVDSYDPTQMHTWARGIYSYNALRMEGFSHTRALQAVGNHAAARIDNS
jgi:hypothetical protein